MRRRWVRDGEGVDKWKLPILAFVTLLIKCLILLQVTLCRSHIKLWMKCNRQLKRGYVPLGQLWHTHVFLRVTVRLWMLLTWLRKQTYDTQEYFLQTRLQKQKQKKVQYFQILPENEKDSECTQFRSGELWFHNLAAIQALAYLNC